MINIRCSVNKIISMVIICTIHIVRTTAKITTTTTTTTSTNTTTTTTTTSSITTSSPTKHIEDALKHRYVLCHMIYLSQQQYGCLKDCIHVFTKWDL